MAKETAILELQIDQGAAERDLLAVEKVLISNKEAQQELNKAYKQGSITQDEYLEENIRLQNNIKKENEQKSVLNKLLNAEIGSRNQLRARVAQLTREYNALNTKTAEGAKRSDQLQKELKELNEEINKGSKAAGNFKDNIGNYEESVTGALKAQVPFVGQLETATKSFGGYGLAIGGAVGVLGALVGAYASSTVGARDLALAQSQLSTALDIVNDSIGDFIDQALGGKGVEGEGIFSILASSILFTLSPALALQSRAIAVLKDELKDLEIQRVRAQGFAKLFEQAAENARRIRDDENAALQNRLRQTEVISQNLEAAGKVRVNTIQLEIDKIKETTISYDKNREAQLRVAQLEAEIRDINEEINGKLTENVTARRNILFLITAIERAERRAASGGPDNAPRPADSLESFAEFEQSRLTLASQSALSQLDIQSRLNSDLLKINKQFYDEDLRLKQFLIELKKQEDLAYLDIYASSLNSVSGLFEQQSNEYKLIASLSTLISTYSTAQKAAEAVANIPYAGPGLAIAAAAEAVISGLARVAIINGVQFAGGGFTGPGIAPRDSSGYRPAGVVHEYEYVVPKKITQDPQYQPYISMLESARLRGYADGGFAVNQATQTVNQNLVQMNALKNLPTPEVSVVEFRRVERRVEIKENISRL